MPVIPRSSGLGFIAWLGGNPPDLRQIAPGKGQNGTPLNNIEWRCTCSPIVGRSPVMVHLPFADRVEAGRLLAKELSSRNVCQSKDAAVVLALTRGGVSVGFAVADRLCMPLDVIVVRKLGVPWQPELAMGAIAGGAPILDDGMIRQLGISAEDVEETIEREYTELRRREELYRGGNPAL